MKVKQPGAAGTNLAEAHLALARPGNPAQLFGEGGKQGGRLLEPPLDHG
ncbi:hypothetical protein [Arthrobacter globiformis]|nr:hypothetical protein [Arthrobacter globiformis]MDQ0617388.1 hypothetical protein [Arthrobacter globiformis]